MKNLILVAAILALVATGCKKQPRVEDTKPAAKPLAEAQAAPPALDAGNQAVLPGDIMDQVPRTEADVAWAAVEKAGQPPEYPDEWALKQPSPEDISAFEKSNSALAAKGADKAREFYKKYPQDARAEDARQQEYRLLAVAVQLGATNRLVDLQTLEAERLKDPKLDEEGKLELRM